MANTLYRAPFYADSQAITQEHRRHHIVTKARNVADEWTITCSCGADTGPCQSEETAVLIWDAHFQSALRNA